MKITTIDDLAVAEKLLVGNINSKMRVGIGTDTHALSSDKDRPLWLAGLHWKDEIGLEGHSDGDVAAHAICDALFSAADLGDLGSNFGTEDKKYAGASGIKLLTETVERVHAAGYSINNVSLQIVGNRPKIAMRRNKIIKTLSSVLDGAAVSVSATTTDGLGFTGEGRGISAIATTLLLHSAR